MKIKVEFDGKTYEAPPMTWDDVEKVEDTLSGFLLNLDAELADATTKASKQKIARQLMATKKEHRAIVEDMLRKYLQLEAQALIDLGFIGATVLFNKLYRANTEVDPFLEMPSSQPLQSDSMKKQTESSSPSAPSEKQSAG